jgi:tungstate transport system substrate-binding protein
MSVFFKEILVFFTLFCAAGMASAQDKFITLASTTSTDQSGLFAHLLPQFQKVSGIAVRVIALGTGQALDAARRGDADVVLVHDQAAEDKFVAEGFGLERFAVMFNDFILIGPRDDPAKAKGNNVVTGLKNIYVTKSPFISRGDKSGTHTAELRYWKAAGFNPAGEKQNWYKEIGQGMGPALNTAAAMNGYLLADRATWLAFKNRQQLAVLIEGDKVLFNQYGVMLVNPAKHPHVKKTEGQAFIDWLISTAGQAAIASYQIGGQSLFFPNAKVR